MVADLVHNEWVRGCPNQASWSSIDIGEGYALRDSALESVPLGVLKRSACAFFGLEAGIRITRPVQLGSLVFLFYMPKIWAAF